MPAPKAKFKASDFGTRSLSLRGRVEVRQAANGNPNEIEGIAQYYGIENDWGEVFFRGTFAQSIKAIASGRVKITDGHFDNRASAVVGRVLEASEQDDGLHFLGTISEVQKAQDVKKLLLEKNVDELSIEFRAINERMVPKEGYSQRQVLEADWCGLAILPYSAQGRPAITEVRSALPFHSLPLAPADTPWDVMAARERVRAWARSGDLLKPEEQRSENLALFGRAFALSEARGTLDGYDLQIADVVNGKLMVVPRAVLAASEKLLRARREFGPAVVAEVMEHLDQYADAAEAAGSGVTLPWEVRSSSVVQVGIDNALAGAGAVVPETPSECPTCGANQGCASCGANMTREEGWTANQGSCSTCGSMPSTAYCSACGAAAVTAPTAADLTGTAARSTNSAVETPTAGPPPEAPTDPGVIEHRARQAAELALLELELELSR